MGTRRGLVIVFTGDGKGKTTAALGMALRAIGNKMRVLILQFIKGKWRSGELAAIERLGAGIDVVRLGEGFTWRQKDGATPELHQRSALNAFRLAEGKISAGEHDMIVLDEVVTAVSVGLLRNEDLLSLLKLRPPAMHLVLTGRGASAELVEAADLVSEMRLVKHPYQRGLKAQMGIEF